MIYSMTRTAILLISLLGVVTNVTGYGIPTSTSNNSNDVSRRNMLQKSMTTILSGIGSGALILNVLEPPEVVYAIDACPKNSKNCIRTTWTPPTGSSVTDIGKTLSTVVQQYPQEGQADIDLGGWTITSGDLSNGMDTKTRIEYSSGVGKFAKFFNGGKSFIDDLDLEINGGVVDVRSASRVGDSDFDVNKKRLVFLGDKLKGLGWTVPEPKY